MSGSRFKPGQSGNPKGRPPKPRRPNLSAFEIVLDKRIPATIGGRERELTVEEVLQQQTLRDALAGKRMAIRKVLRMIAKREAVLAKKDTSRCTPVSIVHHHDAHNANEAMRILGIAETDPAFEGHRWKLNTWATQAALSRPARRRLTEVETRNIRFFTFDAGTLRWPRGSGG